MAEGTRVGGLGERPAAACPAAAAAARGLTPAAKAEGSMPKTLELSCMLAAVDVGMDEVGGGGDRFDPASGELRGVNSEGLIAPTELGVCDPPLVEGEALLEVSMFVSVAAAVVVVAGVELLRHIAIALLIRQFPWIAIRSFFVGYGGDWRLNGFSKLGVTRVEKRPLGR